MGEALRTAGAAALAVVVSHGDDPDLRPFVGPVHLGSAVLLVPADALRSAVLVYFTDMEREEAAASGLPTLGPADLEISRLGAEVGRDSAAFLAEALHRAAAQIGIVPGILFLAGSPSASSLGPAVTRWEAAGFRVASGQDLVRRARKRKTPEELLWASQAGEVLPRAFSRIAATLAAAEADEAGDLWVGGERLRAGRLRGEAASVFAAAGFSQPYGNIVAAGRDAAIPHSQGDSSRALRAGETIVVDLYPRREFFGDATRTFVVGRVPEPIQAAHALVETALVSAREAARPGVSAAELQRETCRRFEAAGWATIARDPDTQTGYVHGLGHGVGYELHELPSFRPGADDRSGRLEENDVITLEPGLYDPTAGWGIRLEDFGTLAGAGLRDLAPMPYALDPRAWGQGGG